MYEIEMKAWLIDRARAEAALNRIGTFECTIDKSDVYWKLSSTDKTDKLRGAPNKKGARKTGTVNGTNTIKKVRVRREVITPANGKEPFGKEPCGKKPYTQTVVTSKSKEVRNDFEVNEETEFTVSSAESFEKLIMSLGFTVASEKHKKTGNWTCPLLFTDEGKYEDAQNEGTQTAAARDDAQNRTPLLQTAHAEIAEVSSVGTFLEIEIISPRDDEKTVCACKQKLNELFTLCGVDASEIEPRYYSELLENGITESNRHA